MMMVARVEDCCLALDARDILARGSRGNRDMSDNGSAGAEPSVRTYRVFIFDQLRCLRRTDLIECADDETAIASGSELLGKCLHGWTVEVWHLARRVFPNRLYSMLTLLAVDLTDGKLDLFGQLSA
jgi:hypothetical protein